MAGHKKLKKQKEISAAFQTYRKAIDLTQTRRLLWESKKKDTIVEVLTMVTRSFQDDWFVQVLDDWKSFQTVNLSFGGQHSGISTSSMTAFDTKIRKGGYLAYAQSYNGLIHVFVGYPVIEEITGQTEAKLIATLEPQDITEELIATHVIQFLDMLGEWEGLDKPLIGYRR